MFALYGLSKPVLVIVLLFGLLNPCAQIVRLVEITYYFWCSQSPQFLMSIEHADAFWYNKRVNFTSSMLPVGKVNCYHSKHNSFELYPININMEYM